MARFGEMERALVALFGIKAGQTVAFHGRLQFLQVRGLPIGVRAGKGQKLDYTRDQALQFVTALVLEQHGVDPKTCVWLVEKWWKQIGRWWEKATDAQALARKHPNPVYMTVTLKLMSETLASSDLSPQVQRVGYFPRFDEHLKTQDGRVLRRENVSVVLDRMEEDPLWDERPPWTVLVNLTALAHGFDLAIKAQAEKVKVKESEGRRVGRGKQ